MRQFGGQVERRKPPGSCSTQCPSGRQLEFLPLISLLACRVVYLHASARFGELNLRINETSLRSSENRSG